MIRCVCIVFAALAVMIAGSGCAASMYRKPSVQASTGSGNSYKVSRIWDYRKNYRIPLDRLKSIVDSYIGVPYRYGGSTRKGMDCSGFVNAVFSQLNHARMPRSSIAISRLGRLITTEDLRPGDLVFFRGGTFRRIDHVGVYMGKGKFVHASRKSGVTYSDMNQEYYKKHFVCARRIF